METYRHINNCPRCKGKMEVHNTYGSMHSFPSVSICCSNKECYWGMTVKFDELSQTITAEDLLDKMIDQWNETLDNMKE